MSATNILTVWGPAPILRQLSNNGFRVTGYPDISGNVYIDTYSEMYFGQHIRVLTRTENSITIFYKGYEGTFTMYLEALVRRCRTCLIKNTYTDTTKTEQWIGRLNHGKVEVLATVPMTEGITDFEIVD